jgi:hypothetical protein
LANTGAAAAKSQAIDAAQTCREQTRLFMTSPRSPVRC